jgi:hypothetical protein
MAQKEIRPEPLMASSQPPLSLKPIERFLRLLTWQMFFLLAVLFYMAFRPQAGRYQVILGKDEIVVFDTSSLRVVPVKPQQVSGVPAGEKTAPGTPSAPTSPPATTEAK